MSKYTEAELKDACLAWASRYSIVLGPSRTFDKWWAERFKPVKKIIDLSDLLASGIDCEFWHDDAAPFKHISEIKQIGRGPINSPLYSALNGYPWEKCRPRMNHKMCHDGSKPIEGFIVKAYFDRTTAGPLSTTDKNIHWPHVKAIEYLDVEDGYAYPWEQSE